MPHNLYLHSSLVQTRAIARSREGIRTALRFNLLDYVVALNFAFFINGGDSHHGGRHVLNRHG